MARPMSFRLPEDLVFRLDEEAADQQTAVTTLVISLIDEGLKTRRFPGVVYRDGPTGRRAALQAGPDVWEIVRDIKHAAGRGEGRIRQVARDAGLTEPDVRLAVDFYAAFPDEIDARIALDERTAAWVRERIARREELLTS
jgi:hypothetical protein